GACVSVPAVSVMSAGPVPMPVPYVWCERVPCAPPIPCSRPSAVSVAEGKVYTVETKVMRARMGKPPEVVLCPCVTLMAGEHARVCMNPAHTRAELQTGDCFNPVMAGTPEPAGCDLDVKVPQAGPGHARLELSYAQIPTPIRLTRHGRLAHHFVSSADLTLKLGDSFQLPLPCDAGEKTACAWMEVRVNAMPEDGGAEDLSGNQPPKPPRVGEN